MKFPDITVLYSLFRESPFVTTDSRKIIPDSFFFALKGDNFNGNQYAEPALMQGCRYAVIDEEKYYLPPLIPPKGGDSGACSPLLPPPERFAKASRGAGGLYILVKDCLTALQDLAAYHRKQLKIPFIAITGSNGKTTTKELIKRVLSKKYKVSATAGNLNNHIGVPLTILSITPDIKIAIIEMGANHPGEIAMLCAIAQPDYGIITNIGKAHVGEFGSFDAIVKAKTEMYRYLENKKGRVFVNSENELLLSYAAGIEKITYGNSEKNFCFCRLSEAEPFLRVNYENEGIASQLIGTYNFENIAAAVCAGKYFGIESKKIREAIELYVPSDNRSQVIQTKKNAIIMDAYNANPSSMRAAIENFYGLSAEAFLPIPQAGKWLILGDMLELGEYAIEEHKNIIRLIVERKFKNVVFVGAIFSKAVSEMITDTLNPVLFKNSDDLANRLKTEPLSHNPSLILIKGSRGIKMEKVVEYL